MFAQTQIVEACLGSALEAAFQVMHHIGGKMCLFQSTLPTIGLGRLKNREDPKVVCALTPALMSCHTSAP